MKNWHKQAGAAGAGLGVGIGLAGALIFGLRQGLKTLSRAHIPDDSSPPIFERKLAETSHGDMVYHIAGKGKPLVFLHGIYTGASSFGWSRVYPRFADTREVLAPDFIGFGESERPSHTMNAADYVQSISEFFTAALPRQTVALVAGGLTATLALLEAANHPEQIERIILLAPHIPARRTRWASPAMRMASSVPPLARFIYNTALSRENYLRSWLEKVGFDDPAQITDEVVKHLAACAQQPGAAHAILHLLRQGMPTDLETRLPNIKCPVFIIQPENRPLSAIQPVLDKIPQVSVLPLPRAGSLAALEIPDAVTKALAQALL